MSGMKHIFLRRATMEDVRLIYEWANDKERRQNSFQSNPIPLEDHMCWYKNKMQSETTLFYILMNGEQPVGQIRLEIEEDCAQVNYSISAEHRGKGYGKEMLRLVELELQASCPRVKKLVAEVKADNEASQRVFENLNYRSAYIVYEKDIANE